ncbi:MbtH family protein [Streptomyces capitiformicae]|uniref:MbtH protein n=1 Tax=Streptomyces capitiformicae TaxID=2014920 RepID=A0A918YZ67_9ACTN|nr:MbtH family NRPS accessory protein [Streptomyces capitiformicae]GHE29401.1 MbtH protein [Streptomyces capitiformicae]
MPFESCEDFVVVRNHEDQYSIWPAELSLPRGWTAEQVRGPRADCLEYIDRVWTDMRPRGLRQATDRSAD